MENRIKLTREYLENLYANQELTMREISDITGYSVGYIHKKIHDLGVRERKKCTERTIEKISKSLTGRISPRKGISMSEEQRRKISESHKGLYISRTKFGGHKKKRSDGYIGVYVPNHPMASKDGYVMEHILVMEEHIGRYIAEDEVVHHKNHIRDDNRIENLELMLKAEHCRMHAIERISNGTFNTHPNIRKIKNVTTGEIFESCTKAAETYNVSRSCLYQACNETWRTVKNCHWIYLEKEN